jgi:hypothetical protein
VQAIKNPSKSLTLKQKTKNKKAITTTKEKINQYRKNDLTKKKK